MSEKKFSIEYAKRGTAGCKKCKQKIAKAEMRIAKLVPNPFSDSGGDMKQWFHASCLFETFSKARASTRVIEGAEDLDGWQEIGETDRGSVLEMINDLMAKRTPSGCGSSYQTKSPRKPPLSPGEKPSDSSVNSPESKQQSSNSKIQQDIHNPSHADNSFRQFRRICAAIANESSYKRKTAVLAGFLEKGSGGGVVSGGDGDMAIGGDTVVNGGDDVASSSSGFQGDLLLWMRMLLPGVARRVYRLQSKQLLKLFSNVFDTCLQQMSDHLARGGDVAATVGEFFRRSHVCQPTRHSLVTLAEVDRWLHELTVISREEEQLAHLRSLARKCTVNDLVMFVRLVKADLRINAGSKHILAALHEKAHEALQMSHDLADVVARCRGGGGSTSGSLLAATISLMTPVRPMLAEACSSAEQALRRCSSSAFCPALSSLPDKVRGEGARMLAEVKYDGERVQLHKRGSEYRYFSRSLKPVPPQKLAELQQHIEAAFGGSASGQRGGVPHELILDAELLLVDTASGQPLPFGSLGVHKRAAFSDATVCLFVFDCLLVDGRCLLDSPLRERRRLLARLLPHVPGRLLLSEAQEVSSAAEIDAVIERALADGLEGVVLKPLAGTYQPGKRRWLKVKRDYLACGQMADSADLVVLGAWYGTGARGGRMSVFLMGCRDAGADGEGGAHSAYSAPGVWRTVTKVANGFDDATLERLQGELAMVPVGAGPARLPSWLHCARNMMPDLVSAHPRTAPVWEIIGAEFTRNQVHTADGISVRFPRVHRQRPDKDWRTATTLQELQRLYSNSVRQTGGGADVGDGEGGRSELVSLLTSPLKLAAASRQGSAGGRDTGGVPEDSGSEEHISVSLEGSGSCQVPLSGEKIQRASKEKKKKRKRLSTEFPEVSSLNEQASTTTQSQHCLTADGTTPKKQKITNKKTTPKQKDKSAVSEQKCCSSSTAEQRELSGSSCFAVGLPSVLWKARVVVDRSLSARDNISRYIIAMDGAVLDNSQLSSATHLVTSLTDITDDVIDECRECGVSVVGAEWVWDSVRSRKMLPEKYYLLIPARSLR